MKKANVLMIVGPTGSGKSALAVELARRFKGEIVSADSRQVYRGLDFGTGKITEPEMRGVPHHLLDIASPKHAFTAHDYTYAARRAIADIAGRGKLAIVVGGSGFYIDVLLGSIVLPDVPANKKLRSKLERRSVEQLHAMLQKRDPERAKTVDRHNKRRLIRALEIVDSLDHTHPPRQIVPYESLWIGISPTKKELGRRIHSRLLGRMQSMLKEAKRLHARGLSYKRMEELGLEYRYLARLLQKKVSQEEFERQLEREINLYAKRQITYWRRNKEILWFDPSEKSVIARRVRSWHARYIKTHRKEPLTTDGISTIVPRNVAKSAHKTHMHKVRSYQLLVAQKQKARRAQN